MNQKEVELSEKIFHTKYEQLGKQEKHVAHHKQWSELISIQQEQLKLLSQLTKS
jgi:hypothetical protein